jgi:hypothetical protein
MANGLSLCHNQMLKSQGTLMSLTIFFLFGKFGVHYSKNLISWASKKHPIVSIFSAEAECVAATSTSCQVVWLRRILNDVTYKK